MNIDCQNNGYLRIVHFKMANIGEASGLYIILGKFGEVTAHSQRHSWTSTAAIWNQLVSGIIRMNLTSHNLLGQTEPYTGECYITNGYINHSLEKQHDFFSETAWRCSPPATRNACAKEKPRSSMGGWRAVKHGDPSPELLGPLVARSQQLGNG